ncbi:MULTISPECIES: hypothetical protein [Stenotrophomonas]|uniref:hypothetical protein n=1 Tax=Stenotrophomonas TaxID=40323 RepID=UPI002E762D7C|nr:hypothetical protein [Stenotrophomonas geniculata]
MNTETSFLSLPISKFLKIGVAIPMAFLVADLFGNGGLPELLLWAVLTAVFYTAAHLSLNRYVAMLAKRVTQSEGESWVDVGGVRVGVLTDREYAMMHLDALRDPRVLGQQIFNIGAFLFRVASRQLVQIPVLFFWIFIGLALAYPEAIPEMFKALSAEGAEKGFTVAPLMSALLMTSIWATLFAMVFGVRYGLRNCYAAQVQRSVCRRVGITETTDVFVYAKKDAGTEAANAGA